MSPTFKKLDGSTKDRAEGRGIRFVFIQVPRADLVLKEEDMLWSTKESQGD